MWFNRRSRAEANSDDDVYENEGYLAVNSSAAATAATVTTPRLDDDMYVADESSTGVIYAIPAEAEEYGELGGSHTAYATTTSA